MKPSLSDWAWLTHCVCQAMLGNITTNLLHVQLHYVPSGPWVLRFYVLNEHEFREDAEDIIEDMGVQIDSVSNFLAPQSNKKVIGEIISNMPPTYERQSEVVRWIFSRKKE
ncbi:hypothetical protein PsAD46_03411 [Pseudovibrio sp. Ad46]|nr:hypothetical protein PsAD46_03411 [Pseudovibrio sp. Ad46]